MKTRSSNQEKRILRNGKVHESTLIKKVKKYKFSRSWTGIRTRWYLDGKLHNDTLDSQGNVYPAYSDTFGWYIWYKYGKKHSYNDRPAAISTSWGVRYWYRDGNIHRDNDKPAKIKKMFGIKEWYNNNLLHRENDNPAYISMRLREWSYKGNVHRSYGLPAVIILDGESQWYWHGERVSEEKSKQLHIKSFIPFIFAAKEIISSESIYEFLMRLARTYPYDKKDWKLDMI